MTLQASQMTKSEILETQGQLTLFAADSPAKLSRSQENDLDLMTQEERCSLSFADLPRLSSRKSSCSKTLKDYCLTTMDELSTQSSIRWGNLGMISNTKCLTLKISAYPKTENVCSLSDILETEVDEKYFLSEEQQIKLLSKLSPDKMHTEYTTQVDYAAPLKPMEGAKTGLYLIDLSKQQPQTTDHARTLQARYTKGIANRNAEVSGVLCIQKTHSTTTNIKFNETGTLQAARLDKVPCIVRPALAQDRHGVIIQSPRGKNKGGIHEIAPTISAHSYQQNNHVISSLYTRGYDGARIRRLTPLECFRLQSYPDSHWQKAKAAKVSDYQLYKQAGNSVTVNVVYEIAKRL